MVLETTREQATERPAVLFDPTTTPLGLPIGPTLVRPAPGEDPWPGTTVQLVLPDADGAYRGPELVEIRP